MMKKFYNKYRMPIIIVAFILGLGFILSFAYLILFDKDTKYQNDYYVVTYDGSWRITEKESNKLVLSHGKGNISFDIIELNDNKIYLDIDSLIDDIKYDIEKNNSTYKLLSKEQTYITKNQFLGYAYLYENNDNNVKVCVYKDSKYIVIITYEANKKYFDMLLDSANNIIYNFLLQDKKYDLSEKLEITYGKITYSESVDYKNLTDTKVEEIANNNYLVNYSIPKNYQSSRYYSLSGSYSYKGFNDYLKSSTLTVNIYRKNIYEYIKDDTVDSLYQKYNEIRSNKNFKENIEKVEDKDDYIYKNSYIVPSSLGDNFYENVELIYSLDKKHILVVVFENKNASVSKELVDSFTINYFKNISSYIKREEKDNKLVSYLKLKDTINNQETTINLRLPLDYSEIDEKKNIYERRSFVYDYNENIENYRYSVKYQIFSDEKYALNDVKSLIENNKNNGKYQVLASEGNKKINEKDFKVYKGSYTASSGLFYEKTYVSNIKLLIYRLSSDKVLSIMIVGNNIGINDDIITSLTSFDVENK